MLDIPIPVRGEDEVYLDRALQLARCGAEMGEVPVGALLVKTSIDPGQNLILAEAWNQVETRQDAMAHAEILVLAEAQRKRGAWRLNGTTLYVTKEPCPMCAGALAHVRVDRIVFGVSDPKAGACGGALNLFELPGLNHRCELTPGIRATESLQLLRDFFATRRDQVRNEGKAEAECRDDAA